MGHSSNQVSSLYEVHQTRERVLVSLEDDPCVSAILRFVSLLRELDSERYSVTFACRCAEGLRYLTSDVSEGVRMEHVQIASGEKGRTRNRSKAFYQSQYEKYFADAQFSRYYNLKSHESLIDEVVRNASPDVNREWRLSWNSGLNEVDVLEMASHYERVVLFCHCEDRLPESIRGSSIEVVEQKKIRQMASHRMTVLIIAHIDSLNYPLVSCAKELVKRDCQVIVVSPNPQSSMNNRAFFDSGFEVMPVCAVDESAFDFIDMAIGAPIKPKTADHVYDLMVSRNTLLMSFANLFSSVVMRINPDFVFTLGESKVREFKKYNLKYNCITIGNPQYDPLLAVRRDDSEAKSRPIRSVLFAEQGGYPYGATGKRQLADMLVRIARDNPSIRFDVKPRYLPSERNEAFHAVSEHLYDFLEDVPPNLHLLESHETIEQIISGYDAFMTMWSTAYLDALVLNMPLLLLGGFHSVDKFDVRSQRVSEAYERLKATGCLCRYDQLKGDISGKFKLVDGDYARDEVYAVADAAPPCAQRVVDFMFHAYEHLVIPELRIINDFTITAARYFETFDSFDLVEADSAGYVVKERYRAALNSLLQEYVYQNRCMGAVLDLSPLEQFYDLDLGGVTPAHVGMFDRLLSEALAACFLDIETAYFDSPEGRSRVREDAILQDFYFDWLVDAGRFDEVIHLTVDRLLVPESRAYNLARIFLERNQLKEAYDCLFEFLRISASRNVMQLLKCRRLGASLAPFTKGPLRLVFFGRLLREDNIEVINYLFKGKVNKRLLMTYERVRVLPRELRRRQRWFNGRVSARRQ